ncbi:MAG TPA: glutaredoxin family protein [Bryobacterales bacterium]|jgi:glutaredoxin|nr:glutaredoxin family protein [Bryobacterales bacterium]
MIPRVTLYTRSGCHLCDEAKEQIRRARRRTPFDLEEIDIDSDPGLRALYDEEVPVVAINGKKAFKYRVKEKELLTKLRSRS